MAGRCNMTSQREIRVEIPASKRASKRWNRAKLIRAWVQIEHGEKEIENGGGKERASNPTRSRRQNTARVSLFFINRLIGKDTSSLPPFLSFYPCFISSNSSSPFLRFLPLPALLSLPLSPSFSPRQIYPLAFFRALCFSFSPTPPTILTPGFPLKTTTTPRWRRGLCHPVLEHFFFFSRYFIQLFSEVEGILLLPERTTPVFSGQ